MFERRSALTVSNSAPHIGEKRGWKLVQVTGFAATGDDCERAMRAVLNGRRVLKTAAGQYWIITSESDEPLALLQRVITPDIGTVTSLSHSRTCLFIEAPAARTVLAKGVALDLHPDVFRVDEFALTGIHHTPVLLHRAAENRYEIYALRTFAQCVWDWLTDAALSNCPE